ncbi:MAG TPA: tetratricopeptide repeat protein [Burkholderiaceae bacterium]|nr:tetratricopeptide repeat protein [Burkholderiaceae bacterium]
MPYTFLSRHLAGAVSAVLIGFVGTQSSYGQSVHFAKAECGPPVWMDERLDYHAPRDQMRIKQIESNHFDRNVEALVKAKTGLLGGDIDFLLRYVPNHPRALNSMVRLALREKTPQPSGAGLPVECYFVRGLQFRPDDAALSTLYGSYLARVGRPSEALQQFEVAEKRTPDDPILLYNMGLVLVDLGDYERARSHAEKAYAAGVDLPGLREKLVKAGHWRN